MKRVILIFIICILNMLFCLSCIGGNSNSSSNEEIKDEKILTVDDEPLLGDIRIEQIGSLVDSQCSKTGDEVIIRTLNDNAIYDGDQIITLLRNKEFLKGESLSKEAEEFNKQIISVQQNGPNPLIRIEIKGNTVKMGFLDDSVIFDPHINKINQSNAGLDKSIVWDIRIENINLLVGAQWLESKGSVLIHSEYDDLEYTGSQIKLLLFLDDYAKEQLHSAEVEQFIDQINTIKKEDSNLLVNFEKKGTTIIMDFSDGEQITFKF